MTGKWFRGINCLLPGHTINNLPVKGRSSGGSGQGGVGGTGCVAAAVSGGEHSAEQLAVSIIKYGFSK